MFKWMKRAAMKREARDRVSASTATMRLLGRASVADVAAAMFWVGRLTGISLIDDGAAAAMLADLLGKLPSAHTLTLDDESEAE